MEPKQTSWKILYSDYSGMEKTAAEFLNRRLSRHLIRQEGVYTLYVLPVEKEGSPVTANAVVLGTHRESALVRRFVKEEEIPEGGYLIRSVENPEHEGSFWILVTAREQKQLFSAAAAFVDRFIPENAPRYGGLIYQNRFFDLDPFLSTYSFAPKTAERGVFSWGHPISDYRQYLEDMARQGLNRLILWNDYKPLNADEVVEAAHRFGIKVNWGFSWGWQAKCQDVSDITPERIREIKENVLKTFDEQYSGCGDGIYFQSFTERKDDAIGGRSIADTVTELVNETAGELLTRDPGLEIQFGLHATSVANRLDAIARVLPEVEIVWEDGGAFPFSRGHIRKRLESDGEFQQHFDETLRFTDAILSLRGESAKTSVVFKGFAMLDWKRFAYQRGPYLLGENDPTVTAHDRKLRSDVWRAFSAEWAKNGDYARRFAEFVVQKSGGKAGLYMAALLDGGVYFPEAVCSEIFLDPFRPYGEIMRIALNKPNVRID